MEWQQKDGKRWQGRLINRQNDEIGSFVRVDGNRQAAERKEQRRLGESFVLLRIMKNNDDDDDDDNNDNNNNGLLLLFLLQV